MACNVCDKMFKNKKNMKDHLRRVHKISAAGHPMGESRPKMSKKAEAAFDSLKAMAEKSIRQEKEWAEEDEEHEMREMEEEVVAETLSQVERRGPTTRRMNNKK